MSVSLGSLNQEQLKKYVRVLTAGEILFEQDDLGNTMFIIVSGSVSVLEKRNEAQFLVGNLAAGQVLGEKAMLTESPYRRSYTVRAETNVTLLEFDNRNLKLVENIIPNFASRILQIAAKRLDRTNKLITILRSLDPIDRVVNTVHFLAQEEGKQTSEGIELSLTVEDVFQVCNVDKQVIHDCLELMKSAKIIQYVKDVAVITDLNALKQYYPELKDRVAA